MARRPKPQPKPAAPATEAAAATGPQHEPALLPDTPIPGAEGQITESTLGDGDATGAAEEAPSATAVPEAPAPDVVNPTDDDHSQKRGPEGYAVEVTGPAKGRWRIGRKFGPEPVQIPAQELTEPELRALDNDPELSLKMVKLAD